MTKKIIFSFAVVGLCCTLQAKAAVQPASQDSVRFESYTEVGQMFQPIDPTYHKGVLVTSPWNGNWFVSLQGGASAFIGNPIGCADLFDRIKPTISASLGKWFTPQIGARIGYGGWQFKDCQLVTQDYHHFHADLMWNVLGGLYGKVDNPRWGIIPYVSLGMIHNPQNGCNPFTVSYGVQAQYRFCKRLAALLEIGNVSTFQDFDGYGKSNRFGDNMLSVSVGLSFTIGKTDWKRAVDVNPYIRQNEWLIDYASELSESNSRYAGQHDRHMRTLNKLKKILEIEGLLDKYSRIFTNQELWSNAYPRNDYSGLNSLRARMRNRHWDGKSPLANDSLSKYSETANVIPNGNDSIGNDFYSNGANPEKSLATGKDSIPICRHSDYLAFINSGTGCIGSPVYFFFDLGTAQLTDQSQLLNLNELARVAKKYGLSVTVVGAADSATGTAEVNNKLSALRADYIATELGKRGVAVDSITKLSQGGISEYVPAEANRHTKVLLYMK